MIKGYATLHPYFCYAKTSFITNIMRNFSQKEKNLNSTKLLIFMLQHTYEINKLNGGKDKWKKEYIE